MKNDTSARPVSRTAVILGASGSVGQALLTEAMRCGGFNRILVLMRRPLNLQSGAQVEERLVPDMEPNKLSQAVVDALREAGGDVFGFSVLGVGAGTAAKFRSIRTAQIAQAMVAAALHPPSQSAIYHYPEMMALIAGR